MDVREAIHTQPMQRLQVLTVAIAIAITMIDGYEILVMAFIAPALSREWGIGPVEVGYLLSAGIFGMAAGATLLSPLADRFGRRRYILASLLLIVVGMLLSAAAQNVPQLIAFRAFAGLFLGGIVASVNTLVAEYCSDRRRGAVMGIYGIGFPAGAALGGAVTPLLIGLGGWRAPFVFGATLTFLMFLVSLAWLPESIEYLIEKRPKGALEPYNRIGAKLGHPPAQELPVPRSAATTRTARQAIFAGIMLRRTVLLWLGFGCLMAAFYFANTWTPKLISDATGDRNVGVTAGVLVTAGGVVGAITFAALSLVLRPRLSQVILMFGGSAAFFLYANNFETAGLALFLAVFVGLFANGGVAGFYAISPPIYPAAVRGTAVGLMIGFGRAVAIVAPILTGYLLDLGWTPADAYVFFGAGLILAGIATLLLDLTYRGRSEDPETPEARAVPVQKRQRAVAPAASEEALR
jgi:benzoate transport